jgi:hypothetical protein
LTFGLDLLPAAGFDLSLPRKTSATVEGHSPLQGALPAFPIANAETPKRFRMFIVGQEGVEKVKRESSFKFMIRQALILMENVKSLVPKGLARHRGEYGGEVYVTMTCSLQTPQGFEAHK